MVRTVVVGFSSEGDSEGFVKTRSAPFWCVGFFAWQDESGHYTLILSYIESTMYSDLEVKFIRHALDTNSEGEAANAAAMFFKKLRRRGVKAYQFLEDKTACTA